MTINDVLDFIDENLESEINIDIIVKFSGYGRRYLQLLFSKYMNMPLGKYIRLRRVTRAALLLRLTQAPMIDIAIRLRFDSQQSFTRAFRKLVGCSPMQYRKEPDWDLSPLDGFRKAGSNTPHPPDISQLESGVIYGFQIVYDEHIPFTRFSDYRWRHMKQQFTLQNHILYCLTEVAGKNQSDVMTIKTVIGSSEKGKYKSQTKFPYKGGAYAHFFFAGNKDDYIFFTNKTYLSTLPFYKIIRRNGPDIEIVKSINDDFFEVDFYIPIRTI